MSKENYGPFYGPFEAPGSQELYWEQLREKPYVKRVREEKRFDLRWLTGRPGEIWGTWGVRARQSAGGLTLMDLHASDPHPIGEEADLHDFSRGQGFLKGFDYCPRPWVYNKKYQVWSENAATLYEESVRRRWSPTSSIPWQRLEPLPEEMERATCQLLTTLLEIETVAGDSIFGRLWQINQHYYEVKLFLGAQSMEEARHQEVLRKRLLANGGGVGRASAGVQRFMKHVNEPSRYTMASLPGPDEEASEYTVSCFRAHVFTEGFLLSLLQAGNHIGQTEVDRIILNRVREDEERHVAFGIDHLRYFLRHHPRPSEGVALMQGEADETERLFAAAVLTAPELVEPLCVLWGGAQGPAAGFARVCQWWKEARVAYLRRCAEAGLSRDAQCYLPPDLAPLYGAGES